jgi:hypothetical protein
MSDDVITEPGVYTMPAEEYHADPVPSGSLSRSGAVKLLEPSTPARFHYERTHGQPVRKTFELGHAAHHMALGDGVDIIEVAGDGASPDEWRTSSTKAEVARVRARGAVPLKPREYAQVCEMRDALLGHPTARRLLVEGEGTVEASLFWVDGPSGIWRRARLDRLPKWSGQGRLIVPDYKSAESANPEAFARSAARYGYDVQAAWYSDGVLELGLADDVAFVFVCQEKTPPYLVNVIELDAEALKIGRTRSREAIETYAECVRTNRWPGYGDDITCVSLPIWLEAKYEDEMVI